MRNSYIILILGILYFNLSCEIINPAEEIPAYLYITPFSFTVNPAKHGSASANITEVWLTVNGDFLGVYSLPASVPVLAKGIANIRLEPGIYDNGIRATPNVYPFYQPFVVDVDLVPNQVDTIRPATTYQNEVRFSFIENFENGSHIFTDQLEGQSGFTLSNDVIFEGSHSGLITLSKASALVELASAQAYTQLTSISPRVYLEMDYQSEVPVVWGVIGFTNVVSEQQKILEPGFRARNNWNKIYFDLSLLVLEGNYTAHKILLQAAIPADSNLEEAKVYLDNIKLVHF